MIMRKTIFLSVAASLLIFAVAHSADGRIAVRDARAEMSKTAPIKHSALIRGDEKPQNVQYFPSHPRLAAGSPGDTLGYTQYDYQSNGSTGNRVVLDALGGAHVAWMNADPYPTPRYVYYNYVAPGGGQGWPYTGTPVSFGGRVNDGYTQISINSSDFAAVAYHNAVVGDSILFALDTGNGLGIFDYFQPIIRFGTEHCIWPYVSIDRNDRIHIVATETSPTAGDSTTFGYTRSTDGGNTWTPAAVIDTVMTVSPNITSSPVSDKVAIVYTHPYISDDQWHNDVYYIQSLNGTTWDFVNGKVNITGYATDDDSLWAYTDCDAVYDYDDNLHIIWNAQYLTDTLIYYNAQLFHYNSGTGSINTIAQFDSSWYPDTWCKFGVWNFSIAKMSIGVDPSNNALFATYTSWNVGDCAMSTYANGDVFLHYSTDDGSTWTLKGNVTDSHTDSCLAGDCDSDHWSSLAEHENAYLHLFWVNDKDAGGVPQTEGSATDNPMLYYRYPNPVRGAAAPLAPALVFPENGMQFSEQYALFDWRDPIGVNRYEIQIDSTNTFANPYEANTNVRNSEYLNATAFLEGTYFWRVRAVGPYGTSAYSSVFTFTVQAGCPYVPGDINDNDVANGVDVGYGVNYFKGFGPPPPVICPDCPNVGEQIFGAGDVNGNCVFNGVDISYFVNYLKGLGPDLSFCENCPPTQ